MAVTIGSSLQVALFVAPVLVLLGLVVGQPMDLVFTPLEIAAVAAAAGISALIALDGEIELARGRAPVLVYAILADLVLRVRRPALGGSAATARRGSRRRRGRFGRQAAASASLGAPRRSLVLVVIVVGRARIERRLGDRLGRRGPRRGPRPGRPASRPPARAS